MKKSILLALTAIGFIAPLILMMKVTIETGNILLWTQPSATIAGAFGNDISASFIVDLLCVVMVFFFWTYYEARRHGIKNIWVVWLLTLVFGMAGPFPLFLYMVQRAKEREN